MGRGDQLHHAFLALRRRRLEISFEHRLERLLVLPFRILGRELLYSVEHERHLHVPRLLTAECPVVIEGRDAPLPTKSGDPCVVTRATNSLIACFAGPSFQDGSDSFRTRSANQTTIFDKYGCHIRLLSLSLTVHHPRRR